MKSDLDRDLESYFFCLS